MKSQWKSLIKWHKAYEFTSDYSRPASAWISRLYRKNTGTDSESVRGGHWKYIYDREFEEVLFHLSEDPTETVNFATNYPERIEFFRKELLQRLAETPPPSPREWVYQKLNHTDNLNPQSCVQGK